METKVAAIVSVIAGILGLLSAALGFAAEATKVKGSESIPNVAKNVCVYPTSPAFGLALASAFVLLVAFIMLNLSIRCFCCYKSHVEYHPAASTRPLLSKQALVFFIFSWLFFIAGFIQMIVAARVSSKANMDKMRVTDIGSISFYSCYSVKDGAFAIAACFSVVIVALGLNCRLILDRRTQGPLAAHLGQPGGIAMGH